MVSGIPSSGPGVIAATGGVIVDENVVFVFSSVTSVADMSLTGARKLIVVAVMLADVVAVVVVFVTVVTSGINGGGWVSGGWIGSEEVELDKAFSDDVDEETTHGISTAIKGRASIRGRGAGKSAARGAAESEAKAPSDWLAAGEEEEDAAAEVEATIEVLNGGVAGSRKRFCFMFDVELLAADLPDMREGG